MATMRRVSFLPVAMFIALLYVPALLADDYSNWNSCKPVYLNTTAAGADVSGDVTNFPVLVRLTTGDFDFSEAKRSGQDIRFAKAGDTTHLAYEIELWDSAGGAAAVWVLVDTVRGNDSTALLMFWGNASAADSSCASCVFSSSNGFEGVWHLNESGTGIRYSATDQFDARPGNYDNDEAVAGLIGGADSLDVNDHDTLGDIDLSSAMTISMWGKPSTLTDWDRYIAKPYAGGGDPYIAYSLNLGSSNHITTAAAKTGSSVYVDSDSAVAVGEWDYIVGTFDASDIVHQYFNGAKKSSGGLGADIVQNNENTFLAWNPNNTAQKFKGVADEVRVESVTRGDDWIMLCYKNQKASQALVEFGQEGGPPPGRQYTFHDSIRQSSDDAEQEETGDGGILSSNPLEMRGGSQYVGLRYQNVIIPQGATIDTAYLQFTAYSSKTAAQEIYIWGDDTDSAATFSTGTNSLSGRTSTSDTVTWNVGAWSAGSAGANEKSPELKSIVQEIVNRTGWSSGNSLALILKYKSGTDRREAYSWDNNTTKSADLHIVYRTEEEEEEYPLAGWNYSKTVVLNTTSSGANVTSTVTDFPVLVRLDRDNFPFYQAQSDGADIRFAKASDSTELRYEIERWDADAKEAEIWVLVDTVAASDSTALLMFWGNSAAGDSSNSAAVFDTANGFVAVYHMNEASGTTVADAAGNRDATSVNNTSAMTAEGVVGAGLDFESSAGDKVSETNAWNNAKVTLSCWFNADGVSSTQYVLNNFLNTSDGWGIRIDNGQVEILDDIDGGDQEHFSTSISAGADYHVVAQLDGDASNAEYFYVNGSPISGSYSANDDWSSYGGGLFMGERGNGSGDFDGLIDEARVENVIRSAGWIKLCRENQKSGQSLVEIEPYVEDYSRWPYSQRIYFNTTPGGAYVGDSVTNFPFLARLTADNFNFYQASSDGSDIRFSDPDGSKLPYDIQTWDPAAQVGLVWVKVPQIDGNSSDDYINIHYGRYGMPDMQAPDSVWDSTFVGVWHLDERPDSTLRDATARGNDGTSAGAMGLSDQVDGIVGSAVHLDGANDYINLGNAASLNIGASTDRLTLSAWVRFDGGSTGADRPIVTKGTDSYGMRFESSTGEFEGYIYDGTGRTAVSNTNAIGQTWYHVTAVYDGSVVALYVDGAPQGSGTSATSGISGNADNVQIGRNVDATGTLFDGIIDEVWISNVARNAAWIKLAHENQNTDGKLQSTPSNALYTTFDKTLANKPTSRNEDSTLLVIQQSGHDLADDTISHAIMRFDLSEAKRYADMGWTLESATLRLTVDDVVTPEYYDSAYFGLYSGNRVTPVSRLDGYRAWREDASTKDSEPIIMQVDTFEIGLGGQPDSSGGWAWLLYDLGSEARRLGFVQLDSIAGFGGHQDGSTSCDEYIRISGNTTSPPDSVWEDDGAGVTEVFHATSSDNHEPFTITGLDTTRWIWLGTRSGSADTTDYAVWGGMKIYGTRVRSAEVLMFQVNDEGLDSTGQDLSFTHRDSAVLWRHVAFENDAEGGSEGIGTEDLARVFPGHDPLWNHYKGKYRSRSPLAARTIDGTPYARGDTSVIYFGIGSTGRMDPHKVVDGYYAFAEDVKAGSSDSITMSGTVYPVGITGTAKGSGTRPYVLYSIEQAREQFGFGELYSIAGTAGWQDGSGSIELWVKTSTNTTAPDSAAWVNTGTGVTSQVYRHSTTHSNKYDFQVTGASAIKWVWIGCYSTSGDGSADIAAWGSLRIKAEPKYNYTVSVSTPMLNQAVEKALENSSIGAAHWMTLLGVMNDSGSVASFYSSTVADYNLSPRLDLKFSDSRTLLAWDGLSDTLTYPKDSVITMNGTPAPSLGDGRNGRVKRFHQANQYASVSDIDKIDYSQGSISFWYQKTLSGGDAGNAVFLARDVDAGTSTQQFKLFRSGAEDGLRFWYGDTTGDSTGANEMRWNFINEIVYIDTIVGVDTTWDTTYDTLMQPFDGGQHYFNFAWDANSGSFKLSIDGTSPALERSFLSVAAPVSWEPESLLFGENTDGCMEELIVRSRTSRPQGIAVVTRSVAPNHGYLPYIQPAFNDTVDCIIISPAEEFMSRELERYAARNISMGIRSVVVDIDDIEDNYPGADIQERLRNFLKQAYTQWRPKWLVIGASSNLIPTRAVAFSSRDGHAVSTDWYYACLEGTWNEDGDAYFAEIADSADLTPELIVGRFPAENWNELRSMIEKSTMAFGLPPYAGDYSSYNGDVMVAGIRMFGNIGGISDGAYYGNNLKNIMQRGDYTAGLNVMTYYPSDEQDRDADDVLYSGYADFRDTLNPTPGLWIQFAHGSFSNAWIDRLYNDDSKVASMLTYNVAKEVPYFSKFKSMSHIRMLGCETASQEQFSLGRVFLAKPYGGALTYLGAAEYSYPAVETRILGEETAAMADSSLFTWGEIYRFASFNVLRTSGAWDLSRWVVFSRNFLGDPLLPVRYKSFSSADTLHIGLGSTQAFGKDKSNTITVTVIDGSQNPVEGAVVSIVSRDIAEREPGEFQSYVVHHGKREHIFARGVTNRSGVCALSFIAGDDVAVIITAVHNDFVPARTELPGEAGERFTSMRYYDINDGDTAITAGNGILEPGDSITIWAEVVSTNSDTINSADLPVLDQDSGSFADSSFEIVLRENIDILTTSDSTRKAFRWFGSVLKAPPGTNIFRTKMYYSYTSFGEQYHDTIDVHFPVTGGSIMPVISYLMKGDAVRIPPQDGDTIGMNILLVNRYPVYTRGVRCSLIVSDTAYAELIQAATDTLYTVGPDTTPFAGGISYRIKGGYSEDLKGLINAKLVITANGLAAETLSIDLNPIRGIDAFSVLRERSYVDWQGGVRMEWDPVKYDSAFGRRSDFRGFVVLRYPQGSDSAIVRTASPISATNYYYERPDSAGTYEYSIVGVDSSYNASFEDMVVVSTPVPMKKGFPAYENNYLGQTHMPPYCGDNNRDGKGALYAVVDRGYSFDYEGAPEPKSLTANMWGASHYFNADLDGDGTDEEIAIRLDSIIVSNRENPSRNWSVWRKSESYHHGYVWSFRRPVAADLDNDGRLEVMLYCMDNSAGPDYNMTTLNVYRDSTEDQLIDRHVFGDFSRAPALAVGNFDTSDNQLETIVAAIDYDVSDSTRNWYLYCFKGADMQTVHHSVFICNEERWNGEESDAERVNSGLSVGNIHGAGDYLEIVFGIGKMDGVAGDAQDRIVVYRINTADGHFSSDPVAWYPVTYNRPTQGYCVPALGSLDTIDAVADIAFAADDYIYALRMTADTGGLLTPIVPDIHFGLSPANRIHDKDPMPQALIADIDNDGNNEILANHFGDGMIWAYNVEYRYAEEDTTYGAFPANGFPLRTRGKVSWPAEVTDLEADGKLDLIAADQSGNMYAWELGEGSLSAQPWPAAYQNSWNTATALYASQGPVGLVKEDWQAPRPLPYAWQEYQAGNSTTPVSAGSEVFEIDADSMYIKTDNRDSINCFFEGPNMSTMKNYTIRGSMKFENTSAVFGVDFYSEWPSSAKKYSLVREADDSLRLYYWEDEDTRTNKATAEDIKLNLTDTWYNFRILIDSLNNSNAIISTFWLASETEPPDSVYHININDNNASRPLKGLVGLFSEKGTGYRYWGPIKVYTNAVPEPVVITEENFRADTVVDAKPYTPENWVATYDTTRFVTGLDTTGFVVKIDGADTCLVYRHKEGAKYPVTCLLAPNTNLEWKNYEVRGTLVKPADTAYNHVNVGVVAYSDGKGNEYKLESRRIDQGNTHFYLSGGGLDTGIVVDGTLSFNAGDTVRFALSVENFDGQYYDTTEEKIIIVRDSIITIKSKVWKGSTEKIDWDVTRDDATSSRIIKGFPGLTINKSAISLPKHGIRAGPVVVRKISEGGM